jgi:enterochelin esterase family protein
MEFDFIKNRVFDDRFSAFAPQGPEFIGEPFVGGRPLETGARVQLNGDVIFRMRASEAASVEVVFGDGSRRVTLIKGEDGVWEGLLPYDSACVGPKAINFLVDGAVVINPFCPVYFGYSKMVNYVEIPDPGAQFCLMQAVPHGSVIWDFYWSKALNTWQRCLVYLPPAYLSGTESYPVLYLQHGAGENETSWVFNGKAAHIMDNLISEGKALPFIIVMNDGMVKGPADRGMGGFSGFEANLLGDCIPFIEKKYRVKAGKADRALAGLSMGSMQTSVIGLTHPELFDWLGLFSGFMVVPTKGPMGDGGDAYIQPHLSILADKERFLSEFKLYYRAIGTKDVHYNAFLEDDEFCIKNGYDKYPNIVRKVYEGFPHDWSVWRYMFHEFAQLVFKG